MPKESEEDDEQFLVLVVKSFRRRWFGYPLIGVLIAVALLVAEYLPARERFFLEGDFDLSYPYRDDTVPGWALAFIGGIGPAFIIGVTQYLIIRSPKQYLFDSRAKDIHLAIIVLGETIAVTFLVTNILKCWVGRLRPNFYAYCDYKGYRAIVDSGNLTDYLSAITPGQYGDFKYCRSDIPDAHYSFPSGHSSISFCGLTFLSLFLLHISSFINFTHINLGKAIRFFIILIPLFSAALVASSRVIDFKHHVEDTVWGSLIGVFGAAIAFTANYGYPHIVHEADKAPQSGGDVAIDIEKATATTPLRTRHHE